MFAAWVKNEKKGQEEVWKKQNKIEKASTYLGTNNEVSGMGSGRPKHYPTALDLPYQSESFFERQDFVRIKYLRVTFSFKIKLNVFGGIYFLF